MKPEEYFANHSLDETFLKDKFAVAWNDTTITIPIYDAKGVKLFDRYRHLTGDVKFTADKGSHPTLYPLHRIGKFKNLVMCEGEPDCLRLWQEGIPAVTATSGVKTFNTKMSEPLKDKNIFIVLDNDEAGQSSLTKYVDVLTKVGAEIKIVELPEEYKDVSDYFTAGFSKEDFATLVKNALTLDEWHEKHEPEIFALETAAELVKQEIPEEEWLVDRVLPVEGFCFIVGAEATGKTFYTLTLANAVATGTPWLNATDKAGNRMFQVKEAQPVLIIDKENTKRRIQSRMKWMEIDSPNIYRVSFPHFFELKDTEKESGFSDFAESLSRKVKKLGIKLVIIDAFTDILVGNENDRADVQMFFDAMRQLFPGTSILALHHASKPAPGVVRTAAQRARGSTNIMAQVYSAFFVEALPKSKNEFVIEQTKAGDSEKLNPFLIELATKDVPGSEGKTMVTHIEYKGEVETQEMKSQEAQAVIEEALKSSTVMSRQQLLDDCKASGVSEATFRRATKEMMEAGLIDSVQDEHQKNRRNFVWIGSGKREIYEEE